MVFSVGPEMAVAVGPDERAAGPPESDRTTAVASGFTSEVEGVPPPPGGATGWSSKMAAAIEVLGAPPACWRASRFELD